MSEQKSKMPDLNEIMGMAGKLFKDIKESVCEIVDDYKNKHETPDNEKAATEESVKSQSTTSTPDSSSTASTASTSGTSTASSSTTGFSGSSSSVTSEDVSPTPTVTADDVSPRPTVTAEDIGVSGSAETSSTENVNPSSNSNTKEEK